ncbi:hypothetical protein BX600DRAFT_60338 [Xylariales sp. PMI_506]|nr:hypothetical protein BX600DRAFT_60338 [Xylariales sp. PMI_506]
MDPSGSAFMVTFQLIALAIELEQVPDDIRRCLELVQTCHRDTQHLIEMRNDNLAELEKRPKELAHVDSIIVSASNSLREVAELVEKCRPDVNQGRTHLGKRLWWRYVDRELFQMQRPIVERHHTAVVSELNYVRQLGLLALGSKPMNGSVGAQREKLKMRRASEYENMGMLDSMFGSGTLNTGR